MVFRNRQNLLLVDANLAPFVSKETKHSDNSASLDQVSECSAPLKTISFSKTNKVQAIQLDITELSQIGKGNLIFQVRTLERPHRSSYSGSFSMQDTEGLFCFTGRPLPIIHIIGWGSTNTTGSMSLFSFSLFFFFF